LQANARKRTEVQFVMKVHATKNKIVRLIVEIAYQAKLLLKLLALHVSSGVEQGRERFASVGAR